MRAPFAAPAFFAVLVALCVDDGVSVNVTSSASEDEGGAKTGAQVMFGLFVGILLFGVVFYFVFGLFTNFFTRIIRSARKEVGKWRSTILNRALGINEVSLLLLRERCSRQETAEPTPGGSRCRRPRGISPERIERRTRRRP